MLQFMGSQRVGHDLETEQPNSHPGLRTGETGLTVCGNCSWYNTATVKSNRSTRWGSTWEYLYEKLSCGLVRAKLLQLCLTLSDSMDCSPEEPRLFCPWDSPDQNTGVGCCALFQGDLPERGIEPPSLMSQALAGRIFTTSTTWEAPWKPWDTQHFYSIPSMNIQGYQFLLINVFL